MSTPEYEKALAVAARELADQVKAGANRTWSVSVFEPLMAAAEAVDRALASEPGEAEGDDEHDCDEDGEAACTVCGYVSGMYDQHAPPSPASEQEGERDDR